MIEALIIKIDNGFVCQCYSCGVFLSGTTMVKIIMGSNREFYCVNCVDIVYKKLKLVLDRKLWAFY